MGHVRSVQYRTVQHRRVMIVHVSAHRVRRDIMYRTEHVRNVQQ